MFLKSSETWRNGGLQKEIMKSRMFCYPNERMTDETLLLFPGEYLVLTEDPEKYSNDVWCRRKQRVFLTCLTYLILIPRKEKLCCSPGWWTNGCIGLFGWHAFSFVNEHRRSFTGKTESGITNPIDWKLAFLFIRECFCDAWLQEFGLAQWNSVFWKYTSGARSDISW